MALKKISALAEAAGISRNTAKRWVQDGVIPGKQIDGMWFVDADALKKLIEV